MHGKILKVTTKRKIVHNYLCIRGEKWNKWGRLLAIPPKHRAIRPNKEHKIRWYKQIKRFQ